MIWTVASAVAGVLGWLRWLRVAQREHYLARGVLVFAWRWWRMQPNVWIGATVLASILVSAVGPDPAALIGAAGIGLAPLGLRVRGTSSRLAWTSRLRRLAMLSVSPLFLSALLAIRFSTPAIALTGAALAPIWIGGALWVVGPLERRLGRVWVRAASETLERSGARVIGITGSYGKTTTKNLLAHLLGQAASVVASPASFNNRMGLARAINEHVTPTTSVFIAEMGTYGPGEIREICSWAPPDISVITALGPVHSERMGPEENILAAKAEILETARVGVINIDHPLLNALARTEAKRRRIVTVSSTRDADVKVDAVTGNILVGGELVGSCDPATTHPSNLGCAVACALEVGIDASRLGDRIKTLPQTPHRRALGRSDKGFVIIDDTYNSNPSGAESALEALEALNARRRVVVTPGMVELGKAQCELNEELGRRIAAVATDLVVVGRTNRQSLLRGASEGGLESVMVVPSRDEAVAWVRRTLTEGDAVLYENDLPDHYP